MSKYDTIFHDVRRRYRLSHVEYCIMSSIDSLSKGEKWCCMSNKDLADLQDVSPKYVGLTCDKLFDLGLISTQASTGKASLKKATKLWLDSIELAKKELKNDALPKNKVRRLEPPTPEQSSTPPKNFVPITPEQSSHSYIIINNDNNKEDYTNVGVGNFKLPCPEKEKKEFSDWLGSIGLIRLSRTCFFLKEEKSCAKKEEIGEARFLAALTAIDEYLAAKPDFLQGNPDFDKVLQKFIVPADLFAAQSAFSSFFAAKYGQCYKSYTKSDNAALNKILKALESQPEAKHLSAQDRVNQFFQALAVLPQFENPLKAKISFISADVFQILAALKKPNFGVGSFGETYKERDARNQIEQHKAQRSRIEEQCFYQQEKEQILRFLENDIPLTDAMKSTQAYKDVFGATPF